MRAKTTATAAKKKLTWTATAALLVVAAHAGRLVHKSGSSPELLISQLKRQLASLLQQLIPTSLSSHPLDLTQLLRVFPWAAHGERRSGLVFGTHSNFLSIGLHWHSPVYFASPLQSESLVQDLTAAGVVQAPLKQTSPKEHSSSEMQEPPEALEAKATQVPASQTDPKAQAFDCSETGAPAQFPPTATTAVQVDPVPQ